MATMKFFDHDCIKPNYISTFQKLKINDTITDLYIDRKDLDKDDILNLIEVIKFNTSITALGIYVPIEDDAVIIKLFEALKHNKYIKDLTFYESKLLIAPLIELIKYNTTIEHLDISGITVYGFSTIESHEQLIDAFKQIVEAIKSNKTLISVNMYFCIFDEEFDDDDFGDYIFSIIEVEPRIIW